MIKNENYIMIQGWMINELNLKGTELIVYAIIYGFTQDGESKYTGSRTYLATWCNTSLPTIDQALKKLIEKNLIQKETEGNQITYWIPKMENKEKEKAEDTYKETLHPYKETLHPPIKKLYTPYKETLHNNIDNKIDNNIEDNSLFIVNLNKEDEENLQRLKEIKEEKAQEELKNYFIERMKRQGVDQKKMVDRMKIIRDLAQDERWKDVTPDVEYELRSYILRRR